MNKTTQLRSITIAAAIVLNLLGPVAGHAQITVDPEVRLKELGLTLPVPETAVANYVTFVISGNLLFLAGHTARIPGTENEVHGKVPTDVALEDAYKAGQYTALSMLSTIKAALGNLKRVKRIVALDGLIQAEPEFTDHSKVMNGASDLLVQVFGDQRGKHARTAVGVASLPQNLTLEITAIVEIVN